MPYLERWILLAQTSEPTSNATKITTIMTSGNASIGTKSEATEETAGIWVPGGGEFVGGTNRLLLWISVACMVVSKVAVG